MERLGTANARRPSLLAAVIFMVMLCLFFEVPMLLNLLNRMPKNARVKSKVSTDNTDKNPNITIDAESSDNNNMYCPASLIKTGDEYSSSSQVWHNLQDKILNASYYSLPTIDTLNTTWRGEYTRWVDQLYSFYTPSRMRRTVMNPAPPKEIMQLLKMAAEIRQHNDDKDEMPDYEPRKLRVLVLGGSVTFGMNCNWPENLGLHVNHWTRPGEACAWPSHLQNLLNRVLFDGEDVVRVDNMAAGGEATEFGVLVLEYRTFPNPKELPDVIISSFSANDAQEPDQVNALYKNMQDFVKAAQSLHPCNDHAPLVMMVDDFYGSIPFAANRQTGNIYQLSTWNNVMAVNYANTVKYKIMAEHENEAEFLPLMFSVLSFHQSIGMHMGIAWTIFFNMVNSIVNVCNDDAIRIETHVTDIHMNNEAVVANDTLIVDDNDNAQENNTSIVNGGNSLRIAAHTKSGDIMKPSKIDPTLVLNLEIEEPPFQHLGRMDETRGTYENVHKELKENIKNREKMCKQMEKDGGAENNDKCTYAWFINRLTGFSKGALYNKMKDDLLFNEGWAAEGYPIRQPREGWYTHTPNATFSIKVENTTVDTNFLIIHHMKSYSEPWKESKLGVSIKIIERMDLPETDIMTTHENHTEVMDWEGESIHFIDGYHDIKTSVHFPHKIPIEGGAKAGDSLILDFKLVGGHEFKIAGMALCSF